MEKLSLILASQSPRRKEILENAGFRFTVRVSGVTEQRLPEEEATSYARRLSKEKALAVPMEQHEVVLGADTVVVVDGHILEKPSDTDDATAMLRLLSGREHVVVTGICLRHQGGCISDAAETTVRFAPMTDSEIAAYVHSGEPMDKAGAYGIQGLASKFISAIDGCYFNVVGLPVQLVYKHWKTLAAGAD